MQVVIANTIRYFREGQTGQLNIHTWDYNLSVRFRKNSFRLLGLALAAALGMLYAPVDASQPSGYDLAAAVNAYRAANGYYALNPHPLVMAAAQAHADWIVATGQGGHIGAGGSDETVRVSWTGYGGGSEIRCDENWGGGYTIDEVMSGSWSDWVHQEVMLNAWGNRYTDIGGGVALRENGRYVFVLNVCLVVGQEYSGAAPPVTANPLATAGTSNYIYGVTRATPLADGTIRHKVLYGQTLATIAEAYGITIDALRELNNIAANSTIIWPEQELLIRPGSSAPAAQGTSMPQPTDSLASVQTVTPLATPTTSQPHTSTPLDARTDMNGNQPNPMLGMLVLGLSAAALVIFLFFSSVRK